MGRCVTIWTEACIQRERADMSSVYLGGMDAAIAGGIVDEWFILRAAGLGDPDHGLPPETLEATDVLVWWGHDAHEDVPDDLVDRVQRRVLSGMGPVVLHSGHHSKIFKRLMGISCNLAWREQPQGETERVWVVAPSDPVAEGLPSSFDIPQSEMYGEPFDIPSPDELVFLSWFQGGEVFRSGCAFLRGRCQVFSGQAMKRSRSISTRMSGVSLQMQSGGHDSRTRMAAFWRTGTGRIPIPWRRDLTRNEASGTPTPQALHEAELCGRH